MIMKDTFVFYRSWQNVIGELPDATQLEIYRAITEYALNDTTIDLSEVAKVAFAFIRQDIDRDIEKYNAICEKNRENAKLGGAPKGNKNAKKQPKTTERLKNNRTEKKQPYYDNDNDNDIIKEKIYKKEIAFKKSIEPFIERYGKETCNNFFLYWTEPNKSKTKLRYEMEKTWDISRRLANWARNEKNFNGNGKTEITTKKYEQLG